LELSGEVAHSLGECGHVAAVILVQKAAPEVIETVAEDAFCGPSMLFHFDGLSGVEPSAGNVCPRRGNGQEREQLLIAIALGHPGGFEIAAGLSLRITSRYRPGSSITGISRAPAFVRTECV
jgi:hypothetical protein